jgi:hypothetical protein
MGDTHAGALTTEEPTVVIAAEATPLTAHEKHARAHAAFKWILGGAEDPLVAYPQRTGSAADWTRFSSQLNRVRQLIQNSRANKADGYCDISPAATIIGADEMPKKAPIFNNTADRSRPRFATRPVPADEQIDVNHVFVRCNHVAEADMNMLLPAERYDNPAVGGAYSNDGLQATMLKVWGDPGVERTPSTSFDGVTNYGPEIWLLEEGNVDWIREDDRWSIRPGQAIVFDPAPAQLTTWCNHYGDYGDGVYVDTQASTYGFQMSNNWTWHSWMGLYAGYPCIDYNAPPGTYLYGYLIASGNFVRCSGW